MCLLLPLYRIEIHLCLLVTKCMLDTQYTLFITLSHGILDYSFMIYSASDVAFPYNRNRTDVSYHQIIVPLCLLFPCHLFYKWHYTLQSIWIYYVTKYIHAFIIVIIIFLFGFKKKIIASKQLKNSREGRRVTRMFWGPFLVDRMMGG